MSLIAEYVSPGHPDRICDQIVNNIVNVVIKEDKDALVGLECAVHTNHVFLDGRIAAGEHTCVIDEEKIKEIIKNTYEEIGYSKKWYPSKEDLIIDLNVCLENLSNDERKIRNYSDDQSITCGYAFNNPKTNFLPIEQYVVKQLGNGLWKWYKENNIDYLGPDFKILIVINKNEGKYSLDEITLSWLHDRSEERGRISFTLRSEINELIAQLRYPVPLENNWRYLTFNNAGDFIQGGPNGDNGLSGKKLVVDFYGPNVPIGGGAIFGKDPHKVDVVGARRCRDLALHLVKKLNYPEVFTRIVFSPGDTIPRLIEAYGIDEFGTKYPISRINYPPNDWFSIECTSNEILKDKTVIYDDVL